jgi:hypothetical protein
VQAIASGQAPQAVLAEISRLEGAIAAAEAELAGLSAALPSELDLRRFRKRAYEVVGRFKDLLLSDIPLARQALRKLLPEPIQFAPQEGRGLLMAAKLDPGGAFALCLGDKTP